MSVKIDVEKLKNVDGVDSKLTFSIPKEEFHEVADVEPVTDMSFEGTVENLDRHIVVTATIRGDFLFPCDRCGGDAVTPVRAEFVETFTNLEEDVVEDAETEVHLFQGNTIDLFPYIERALFLERPMKILCREDCKGLCPQCGQDLNESKCSCDESPIDPRLAVLAELLHQDTDEDAD